MRFVRLVYLICLLSTFAFSARAQSYNQEMQRGQDAWDHGSCKEAESAFQNAKSIAMGTVGLAGPEERARILAHLTEARLCVGDYDDALAEAGNVLALTATAELRAEGHFLKAEAEKGKGQYGAAQKDYEEAVNSAQAQAEPAMARYLAGWSELASFQGDFGQAQERIGKALALVSDPPSRRLPERAYVELVAGDIARDTGDYAAAGQRYKEAIGGKRGDEDPYAGGAHLGLGLIELARGNLKEADAEISLAEASSRRTTASDLRTRAVDARGLLELAKGNFDAARNSLQRALDNGGDHPATAISISHLGRLYLEQQQVDQALAQFKKAEAIERALGAQRPDLAVTLEYLGRAYRLKHDSPDAKAALDEALRIQTAVFGKDSLATAAARFEGAGLLADQGDSQEAESSYRQVYKTAPAELRLHTDATRELALVLHRETKNEEAAQLIAEWTGQRGKNLPLQGAERLPVAMASAEICLQASDYTDAQREFLAIVEAMPENNIARKGLADAFFGLKRYPEAEGAYKASLPKLTGQPDLGKGWANLGKCYAAEKRWKDSTAAFQKALSFGKDQEVLLAVIETSSEAGRLQESYVDEWLLETHAPQLTNYEAATLAKCAEVLVAARGYAMAERVLRRLIDAPPGGVNMNRALEQYAEVSAAQNKGAQAAQAYEQVATRLLLVRRDQSEAYLVKAKALREQGGDAVALAGTLQALGDTYIAERKSTDAKPVFEQAANLLKQAGLDNDPRYAAALNGQGEVAQRERNFDQAETLFTQADDLLKKVPDPPKVIKASVLYNLGNLEMSDNKPGEAVTYFDECLSLTQGPFTQDNPPPVDELNQIANAYFSAKQTDKAENLYQESLKLRREFFGEKSIETAWGLHSIQGFYSNIRSYDKAINAETQALPIFEAVAGPNSDEVSIALGSLSLAYYRSGDAAKAIEYGERCADLQMKLKLPPNQVNSTLSSLGQYYNSRKDYSSAFKVYEKMVELWKGDGWANSNFQTAKANVVVAYVNLREFDKAKQSYQELYRNLQKDRMMQQTAARKYASALKANGRAKDARKALEQVGLTDST